MKSDTVEFQKFIQKYSFIIIETQEQLQEAQDPQRLKIKTRPARPRLPNFYFIYLFLLN